MDVIDNRSVKLGNHTVYLKFHDIRHCSKTSVCFIIACNNDFAVTRFAATDEQVPSMLAELKERFIEFYATERNEAITDSEDW